jgi:hypothetical protein
MHEFHPPSVGGPASSAVLRPCTYPARPLNGGPLERALPRPGHWHYEPKCNGWRALVHAPTGTMFNRYGHRLTIQREFSTALALLLPIASRLRSRLRLEALSPKQLQECLNHLLKAAGNPRLMSASLIQTLCEHAAGNLRLLMNMAGDLLAAACHQEREQIDEKLYFEVFALDPKPLKKS